MRYLIYALIDPRTKLTRYIGKSSSGLKRPKRHLFQLEKDPTYKANWIRELVAAGLSYEISVLEEMADPGALNAAEIRWIAHGRAQGWPLTNMTAGGDGLTKPSDELRRRMSENSKGRILSPESREKVAASKRGKKRTAEERAAISIACLRPDRVEKMRAANLGRVRTEEHQRRLNESRKGHIPSTETRAKMSAAAKLRPKRAPITEETRLRMSQAQIGKKLGINKSDETRARMSAARRGCKNPSTSERNRSPENRAAVSKALTGRVFSPETIQRMREGQRRRRAKLTPLL